jgi:pyridoxal phosphate-dependent aminotransferase EpsN
MSAPLKRYEKRVLLSVPHMGGAELGYVQEAFTSNWLSTVGSNLTALEQEFSVLAGSPSVALGSGTAGIHLGLKLLGIKVGDEVVTPSLTFAASCNPICYERAIPVFIDSEMDSWNLDPQLLSDFLGKRSVAGKLPKAVTVVHLFGQTADMAPILEICRRYEILVLEDAAEALGASYKGKVPGTMGDVGVYSFNGNKIITSTSGGMLIAQKKEWTDKVRYWSTQARDSDPEGLNNYYHSELGYNYRLSNVLAGIARGQLEVLEQRVQQRRAVFDRYQIAFADLPGIEPQPEATFGDPPVSGTTPRSTEMGGGTATRHTRWLSCFLIDEQKFGMTSSQLIRYLDAANIESRPVWKPMHTQKYYEKYECIGGSVAEDLNRRGICLPSSSSLSLEDQEFVIETIRAAHLKNRSAD